MMHIYMTEVIRRVFVMRLLNNIADNKVTHINILCFVIQGSTGLTGPTGRTGSTGSTGLLGPTGATGEHTYISVHILCSASQNKT